MVMETMTRQWAARQSQVTTIFSHLLADTSLTLEDLLDEEGEGEEEDEEEDDTLQAQVGGRVWRPGLDPIKDGEVHPTIQFCNQAAHAIL